MRVLAWTALAATLVLIGTNKSQGNDTMRLGGTGDAELQSLDFDDLEDTQEIAYRGGGGGGGRGWSGSRGWSGGSVGGVRGWSGSRGWGWGGVRVGVGFRGWNSVGWNRVGWNNWGWNRFGWNSWGWNQFAWNRPVVRYWGPWPSATYSPSFYVDPSFYYVQPFNSFGVNPFPCADDWQSMPNATTLGSNGYVQAPLFPKTQYRTFQTQQFSPARGDGTFIYDGGPRVTIPLPSPRKGPTPNIIEVKQGTVPVDGGFISLPGKTSKNAYPAYGETAPISAASTPEKTTPVRIAYFPAFGER